jgi:hypothetical protein
VAAREGRPLGVRPAAPADGPDGTEHQPGDHQRGQQAGRGHADQGVADRLPEPQRRRDQRIVERWVVGGVDPQPLANGRRNPRQRRGRGGQGGQLALPDQERVPGVGALVRGQERPHGERLQGRQGEKGEHHPGQPEPQRLPLLGRPLAPGPGKVRRRLRFGGGRDRDRWLWIHGGRSVCSLRSPPVRPRPPEAESSPKHPTVFGRIPGAFHHRLGIEECR